MAQPGHQMAAADCRAALIKLLLHQLADPFPLTQRRSSLLLKEVFIPVIKRVAVPDKTTNIALPAPSDARKASPLLKLIIHIVEPISIHLACLPFPAYRRHLNQLLLFAL